MLYNSLLVIYFINSGIYISTPISPFIPLPLESESHSLMSDSTPPQTVHGILQARILEWVAFPFSRDLPNPGIKPMSPALQMDSLPAEPQGKPLVFRDGVK